VKAVRSRFSCGGTGVYRLWLPAEGVDCLFGYGVVWGGFFADLEPGGGIAFDDGLFVGGKTGAFVEKGANLTLKLAHGRVAFDAFVFVEGALPGVVNSEQFDDMGP